MAPVLESIMKIFEGGESDDYGYVDFPDEDIDERDMEDEKPIAKKDQKLGVVRPINSKGYEVMVISPKSFNESLEISKNLINRKTVVMNLELLSNEDKQRVVDFLAGATFALDGNQQKIGEDVFIFTPTNVNITAEQEKKAAANITDAFWSQLK